MNPSDSIRGVTGAMLAQTGQGASEALVWAMVLIVAAIVGGLVIMEVRKRMLAPPGNDIGSEGLFDALKRMRDTGELSQGEYDAARRRILEKAMEGKMVQGPPKTPAQVSILAAAARDEAARSKQDELLAPPGYDLTGEPLPDRRRGGESP